MDFAVPEETFRKIFRAKKTMKVSDRKQLEFLHVNLPSSHSVQSPLQPTTVNVKLCKDTVSMEVDTIKRHGTTHTITTASSSLMDTPLITETSDELSISASLVASSQNTQSNIKDISEGGTNRDKDSKLPIEGIEKMNGVMNGHELSNEDNTSDPSVTAEKTQAFEENQDTFPILKPTFNFLQSLNMAVLSTPSPSLSPTHTEAESDQDVGPGFLVLSEDEDIPDESEQENDQEQKKSEDGGMETIEVTMEKPGEFRSGATEDNLSNVSPLHFENNEAENRYLQGKRVPSRDSGDRSQELGESDSEELERRPKRPRVDYEELEVKISGSAESQSKLKKVVQQLVEEQVRVLQLTLFDQGLQELRDRMEKIDKNQRLHSNFKKLQTKFDQLSKIIRISCQATENANNQVTLPTDVTETSTATSPAISPSTALLAATEYSSTKATFPLTATAVTTATAFSSTNATATLPATAITTATASSFTNAISYQDKENASNQVLLPTDVTETSTATSPANSPSTATLAATEYSFSPATVPLTVTASASSSTKATATIPATAITTATASSFTKAISYQDKENASNQVLLPADFTETFTTTSFAITTATSLAISPSTAPLAATEYSSTKASSYLTSTAITTATSTSGSAIAGLRMLLKNIEDPKGDVRRSQIHTRLSTGPPKLPLHSTTFSAGSKPTCQTLMLTTSTPPAQAHSGFSLQPFIIMLPDGRTAILTNPNTSQLIPASTLNSRTNSNPINATAFILPMPTPSTPVLPQDPSASSLLKYFTGISQNNSITVTPADTPPAEISHTTIITTPITTPRSTNVATLTPGATHTTIVPPQATPATIVTPTTTSWPTPKIVVKPATIPLATPTIVITSTTTPLATPTIVITSTTTPLATPTIVITSTTTPVATPTFIVQPGPTPWATTTTTPKVITIDTNKSMAPPTTAHRAQTITTFLVKPRTTPMAIPTISTMAAATPITPPCTAKTTSRDVHPGASGIHTPISSVSVSVCKSTSFVSVVNSPSSPSRPRLPVSDTVQTAAPVEPQLPSKTVLTQTSRRTRSKVFIDLTEDDDEDDEDVVVMGVLKPPMSLKTSPITPTAGQPVTATQQSGTAVGLKASRHSLPQTLASSPHRVHHRPLQYSPLKSTTENTSSTPSSQTSPAPPVPIISTTENTSTLSSQNSPIPPLPVLSLSVNLPLEAASTSPPQQPLLRLTQAQPNNDGIVLSWSVTEVDRSCAPVDCYHLYAYHQDHSGPAASDATSSSWKKIGEVKALALPMACTLTQFVSGSKYYFVVHAKDVFGRFGPFSEPQCTDVLMPSSSDVVDVEKI